MQFIFSMLQASASYEEFTYISHYTELTYWIFSHSLFCTCEWDYCKLLNPPSPVLKNCESTISLAFRSVQYHWHMELAANSTLILIAKMPKAYQLSAGEYYRMVPARSIHQTVFHFIQTTVVPSSTWNTICTCAVITYRIRFDKVNRQVT